MKEHKNKDLQASEDNRNQQIKQENYKGTGGKHGYVREKFSESKKREAYTHMKDQNRKLGGQKLYKQEVKIISKQSAYPKTLEEMSFAELNNRARSLGIIGATLLSKENLMKKIRYVEENPNLEMEVEGVLEKFPDGFGFLRSVHYDYISGPDDVYVSPSQIRRFSLRTGDTIKGIIRKPKEGEKYFALLKIDKVNDEDPSKLGDRLRFDQLTPLHPNKKLTLEFSSTAFSSRIMDLFVPIGKGQRGLIVAPPKVGKTLLLKEIAQAIIANHPEMYLIVLGVDERPEEASDMRRTVKSELSEVISSTFDEPASRHVQVAEIVLEKAKRLVESGKDVIILLDSITRLARAYNTVAPSSGKVLTGGIDANALQRPKRFFGPIIICCNGVIFFGLSSSISIKRKPVSLSKESIVLGSYDGNDCPAHNFIKIFCINHGFLITVSSNV